MAGCYDSPKIYAELWCAQRPLITPTLESIYTNFGVDGIPHIMEITKYDDTALAYSCSSTVRFRFDRFAGCRVYNTDTVDRTLKYGTYLVLFHEVDYE